MLNLKSEFVTDTATLCVFDLESLRHRIVDDSDWWCVPKEELVEVNKGNVAFVGLGSDGKYIVVLSDDDPGLIECVSFLLACPSGRVFVGAGEEVTGGELEPEGIRGGTFLTVEPGGYLLSVGRVGDYQLRVNIIPMNGQIRNNFKSSVRI